MFGYKELTLFKEEERPYNVIYNRLNKLTIIRRISPKIVLFLHHYKL